MVTRKKRGDADLETYLLTAVSTLAGAVLVLWGSIQKHAKLTEKRLNDCEEDRSDLWEVLRHFAMSAVKHDPKGVEKAAEIATQRLEKKRHKPLSDA